MRAQSFLIKPASSLCNMHCKYCFYADLTDMRTVESHGVMSLDTLEAIVRSALSEVTEYCSFGFQGGEPTLAGLDFYRALLELERKYNVNSVKIGHALQTNGILINEEWAEFLAENAFLTGLSIDAGKPAHDALRLDSAGKGTHSRAMAAARVMREAGAEFNILSVLTKELASHPDKAWSFYKREGFRFVQFIPCLDGLGQRHGANPYSLDAKTYGAFLCRVFDLWYADFMRGIYISVRAFDNYINMLAGRPPESCAMVGRCTAYPLIEADGSVYPCDFYALDEYKLGNVHTHSFSEMLSGQPAKRFCAPSLPLRDECGACGFYSLCRAGCRRDREPIVGGIAGQNYYCEAYKLFFTHALPHMRQIAAAQQRQAMGGF